MSTMATTPSRPGTGSTYTTPSRLRTTIATPSRLITPSRDAAAVPLPQPVLSKPLRTTIFARDLHLRHRLTSDLASLDFALSHQTESMSENRRLDSIHAVEWNDSTKLIESQIKHVKQVGEELMKTLERERSEVESAKKTGKELEERRREMQGQVESLTSDVLEWETRIKRRRGDKTGKRDELQSLKGETEKEGQWLEVFVGMKIRGKTADLIQFKFTFIDPNDYRRPFTFDLDTSTYHYAIPECHPPLPELSNLLGTLNSSRDFYAFIKSTRKAFKLFVEQERSRR